MPRAGLAIEDLHVAFPLRRGILARTVAHVHALNGVDLQIAPGEILGLAGESGCGKTTLGRAIAGLEIPAKGGVRFGEDAWDARRRRFPKHLRRRVQMIFQDPMASLNPRLPICDLLTEGPKVHGLLQGKTPSAMAIHLLEEVGLSADDVWRYPFELSGGQRQRVCIARAMALEPEWVVCDEVVSALDVSVQAQVLNLLLDLHAARKFTLIFISHDLGVLRNVCERIAVMYLGRLVEIAPAEDLTQRPLHPYSQGLLRSVPVPYGPRELATLPGEPPSAVEPPPGCAFHPRCPLADARCRSEQPLLRQSGTRTVACHHTG